jgi:hypothetical protein
VHRNSSVIWFFGGVSAVKAWYGKGMPAPKLEFSLGRSGRGLCCFVVVL